MTVTGIKCYKNGEKYETYKALEIAITQCDSAHYRNCLSKLYGARSKEELDSIFVGCKYIGKEKNTLIYSVTSYGEIILIKISTK